MMRALPSRLLDIVGGGPIGGGAAPTRPLAGGPAAEPTTPLLLGDLRDLPANGQPSNLPLGPQPTPPAWPAQPVPPQAPPAQQEPWPLPKPRPPVGAHDPGRWPELPVPQERRDLPPGARDGQGNPVAQVLGAVVAVGMTIWSGIKSIIGFFRGGKRRKLQPRPIPAPEPVLAPQPAQAPTPSGAAGGPRAAARPAVDPRVVEAVAEANRTLATVAEKLERLSARRQAAQRQAAQAGGPGQIIPFPKPLAGEAPVPAPVQDHPVPAGAPEDPPVKTDARLAAILAEITGLLVTLTKLLEKLLPEPGAAFR